MGLRTPRNCLPDSEAVNGEEVGNFYRPDYWGSASGYLDCAGRDQTSQKKHALSLSTCPPVASNALELPLIRLCFCFSFSLRLPTPRSLAFDETQLSSPASHLSLAFLAAAAFARTLTHAFSCESSAPTARPTASLFLSLSSALALDESLDSNNVWPSCCLSTLHLPTWLPSIQRLLAQLLTLWPRWPSRQVASLWRRMRSTSEQPPPMSMAMLILLWSFSFSFLFFSCVRSQCSTKLKNQRRRRSRVCEQFCTDYFCA